MLKYLADLQETPAQFLPIQIPKERILVHRKLNQLIKNEEAFKNHTAYEKIIVILRIFQLMTRYIQKVHHTLHNMSNRGKKSRPKDAAIASGSIRISKALESMHETKQ